MSSKTFYKVAMIVCWLCAAVWWFNVALDLLRGGSAHFLLHISCAVIWTVLSVVLTIRVVKPKEEDEE